ncbi:hypothetical protein SDC9_115673 [bioreactor metagenome]|uniref:Uncharacterized protein n=1 Tax=bioreactor metagenome TaxID=1076179 RepID=A0A645BTJ4_9ZZZZ
MLRALGYSDAAGGDFSYVGALAFAQEKNLVISSLVSDSFTRDELVAVSHQTLRTPVKGSDQTLLEKLTSAGAIDKMAAAALTDRANIVKECSDILLQNIADYTALDCSAKFDFTASIRQKAFTSVFMYNLLADLKFIYADTASKADLAFTMVDPISNEQYNYHVWVKDGWVYLQEGERRIKIQIDFEELREIFDESKQQMDTGITEVGNTVIPSYIFSKVAKTQTDEGTLYEFVISPKFISAVFRQAYGDAPVGSSTYSVVINSANLSETILIKDATVKKATVVIDVDVESSEFDHFTGQLNYVVTVNAIGDDVAIDFPDFSDFVEESDVEATEVDSTAQTGGKA